MIPQSVSEFAGRVHDQLFGHILPFWTGPALDHEQGGWLAWMSNDLRVDRSQPKGLILNSRILWTFSAVFRAQPRPLYREMAHRAFAVVMEGFWDPRYGGAFWRLDGEGRVQDDSKKTYGQAFYIYALAEYCQAFGEAAALDRAKELFELVERHAHDPQFGGYWEMRRRDWSEAADVRLSDKDLNEKKSMNSHLHVLEAYTSLCRVWKEPRVERRLHELIDIFERRILDAHSGHLHHFFDEQWQVRSDTYTFGHDIEASWLLWEAAEVLEDAALLRRVREVVLRIAEMVLNEGLDADGGLCYEGKAGKIIDRRKECWPQAEAVVGFINAFQLSDNAKYLEAARRVWNYLEQHLVDRVHGEWFWRINADGRPDPDLPKVSEWKGPYHGSRACLETLRRLKQIGPTQSS
ncbi:MAG: AGE family epimerase/isomerase [Verrucomicrobiota bacterium]|jgi:mannobiose 2-epimerase